MGACVADARRRRDEPFPCREKWLGFEPQAARVLVGIPAARESSLAATFGDEYSDDITALQHLQYALLHGMGGQQERAKDTYERFRQILIESPEYDHAHPDFIRENSTLDEARAFLEMLEGNGVRRQQFIEDAFKRPFARAYEIAGIASSPGVDSSSWTGVTTPRERVAAVKVLAPVALAGVDVLLDELCSLGGNGGPPLEDRNSAIENLRRLRDSLTELIAWAERPEAIRDFNEGLVTEAASYAHRLLNDVRGDPLRYTFSLSILALLAPFDGGIVSGWIAAAALQVPSRGG